VLARAERLTDGRDSLRQMVGEARINGGIRIAVEQVLGLGQTQLGFIGGYRSSATGQRREAGFRVATGGGSAPHG